MSQKMLRYLRDSPAGESTGTGTLYDFLEHHPAITLVAFQWVDYCGQLRARMLTKAHALHLEEVGGVISSGLVHMTVLPDNSRLPGHPPNAIEHFRPDWSSLAVFSYHEKMYASVQCDLVEEIHTGSLSSSRCPRTVLKHVLSATNGINFLIGFEIEFMILRAGQIAEPTDGYSSASVFRTKVFSVLEECVRQLESGGISVCAFHAEGSGSQFEISTGPLSPIKAVDTLVRTQDIIRGVIAHHGYHATMHPKPFKTRSSNGMHANISFQPIQDEDQFIAGILNRLSLLCAFSMPFEDSYKRISKGECGLWIAWGTQNRDVPLRKIHPGRWEIRCLDSTANPYLAIATYIAAGLAGIHNQESLELRDCDQWASDMSYNELSLWNISDPMPRTLVRSVSSLEKDSKGLGKYIGDEIISRYTCVKRYQMEKIESLPEEDRNSLMLQVY